MCIDSNLYDHKVVRDELIRNTIAASVSMIPVAGGTLSLLFDKYLPSTEQKRRDKFLNDLSNDLESLPNLITQRILNSEEYHNILLKTFKSILEEDKTERINGYRNILINAANDEVPNFNEIDYFYKLLGELVVDQIKILHLFYLRDCKETIWFTDIYDYIYSKWKEFDSNYCKVIIPEMMRYGIITNSIESKREFGDGYHLTNFGKRFILYIFSPIEL